jgi:hypothetical protein
MLKGGLVLELRLERARTTKDVDLRMVGSPDDILAKLRRPCASTRSRRTSRRSFTHTRCRADARTRA